MDLSLFKDYKIKQTRKLMCGCEFKAEIQMKFPFLLSKKPGKKQPLDAKYYKGCIQTVINRTSRWQQNTAPITLPSDKFFDQMIKLRGILGDVKFRTSSYYAYYSTLTIYSNDDAELASILKQIKKLDGLQIKVRSIYTVEPSVLTALREGKMVVKRIGKQWKYHVHLTSGWVKNGEAASLASYIKSLGDEIETSPAVLKRLDADRPYLYGAWLRVSNKEILDFISILSPGIVQKVVELHHAQ